ncbi:LytTR family DNA-binding domain-containing protein [Spirosoma luteum]|uniref:LytTR family DNA-binding domain-containing protein n=1 Tax=Spirosoma luteum TaxID=431553 RepID=UPI0003784655|nr:LytTR family DNA-binding domain-containing protein [Spirosoma luteum]
MITKPAKTFDPASTPYLTATPFGNYTWVHSASGPAYLSTYKIGKLSTRFPGFVRVHRRHLVNPAYVQAYRVGRKGTNRHGVVVMQDGTELVVSRKIVRTVSQVLCQP